MPDDVSVAFHPRSNEVDSPFEPRHKTLGTARRSRGAPHPRMVPNGWSRADRVRSLLHPDPDVPQVDLRPLALEADRTFGELAVTDGRDDLAVERDPHVAAVDVNRR